MALMLLLLFGYTIAKFSSSREKNRLEKAIAAQDIKNREDKIAFLSNIAHELRTPLSLIYNPVKDFLQEKSVDGIDYERMERIFNQVNKMTVMVNMILESRQFDAVYAAVLETSRSVMVSDLKTAFEDGKEELGIIGLPIKYYSNVRDAVTDIITIRKSGDLVFAAGSLYLAGQIKSFM